jgi:ferrous iron transport protein B
MVAVAGNPNSGKSTLFNALTGLRQKVGNYPGVTVEKKVGRFHGSHGEPMDLLDLPGTYSLQTRSPDEAVARDILLGRRVDTPRPDVILCVVDASNLHRNLYLVAQLAELGRPMVVALNMIDIAERKGLVIDVEALAKALGCPVVPVVASERRGIVGIRQAVTQQLTGAAPVHAPLPEPLATLARQAGEALERDTGMEPQAASVEGLLLLGGSLDSDLTQPVGLRRAIAQIRTRVDAVGLDAGTAIVEARYAWVRGILAMAVRTSSGPEADISARLDRWLTHKFWGWACFLGVMSLMFFMIFRVAEVPMGWIESGQAALGAWLGKVIPSGDFQSLVTDGIVSGVGGVLVFLPQILILYLFIGLLEDTGYMARAAFIIDRLMGGVGLQGKSFVPMLSSFACAIPGVMATRTIENPRDRLVTILVAPLMSCSARLPVYTLLIAVLLPPGFGAWEKAGLMLGLYALGMGTAFGMAWVLRGTVFKRESSLFLLEMPPYRKPSLRVTLERMRERAGIFLRRAGTVILGVSIVIWALSNYPKPAKADATPSEALAASAAGKLGHAIEPVLQPLGYDWKMGVGIISSFVAREVFVGTMSVIYSVERQEDSPALREAMVAEKRADGTPVYTAPVCLGLLVYYVLAMQCLSTVAVVRRETNSWKWPLFQLAYMNVLAWVGAFLVYQIGTRFL